MPITFVTSSIQSRSAHPATMRGHEICDRLELVSQHVDQQRSSLTAAECDVPQKIPSSRLQHVMAQTILSASDLSPRALRLDNSVAIWLRLAFERHLQIVD